MIFTALASRLIQSRRRNVHIKNRALKRFCSPCDFFQGLSLALRSHHLIPASYWSTQSFLLVMPGFSRVFLGFSRGVLEVFLRFFGVFPEFAQGFWRVFQRFSRVFPGFSLIFFITQPLKKLKQRRSIVQPLQNCIGPNIRIGREILCLPYAGFYFL